jgi:tetratricopeptide (TPR) repeat protein
MLRMLLAATAVLALAACAGERRSAPVEQADRLGAAGAAALAEGRSQAAVARFTAAAEASAAIDDAEGLSRALHNRGLALLAAGRPELAAADLAESLRISERAGSHLHDRARTGLALAGALALIGRLEQAADAAVAACETARTDGDSVLLARCLATRAAIALRRGDKPAAQADLAAAAAAAGSDAGAQAVVAVNRGHLLLADGAPAAARLSYDAAITGFRASGEAAGLAAALSGAARAAEASGDRAGAADLWRRAAEVPHGGPAARDARRAEAERLAR